MSYEKGKESTEGLQSCISLSNLSVTSFPNHLTPSLAVRQKITFYQDKLSIIAYPFAESKLKKQPL